MEAETLAGEPYELAATIAWGGERVVRVDQYATDFEPSGHILFCHNLDQPGMVGKVGTILGAAGVNIGRMDVGPVAPHGAAKRPATNGGEALMILSLDDTVPDDALERIRQADGIASVESVTL